MHLCQACRALIGVRRPSFLVLWALLVAAICDKLRFRFLSNLLQVFLLLYPPFHAMSGSVDSKAVFKAKLAEKNVLFLAERFETKGITTLGELAFSTSYMPGQGDEEVFKKEVLGGIVDVTIEREAKLVGIIRRLFFEAFTVSAYNLRTQLERKGDEPPAQLNNIERLERRKAFEAQHSNRGPSYWEGDRKASDDMLDAYFSMWEQRDVVFLPWSERTNQKFMRDHAPRKEKKRTLQDFYTDDQGRLTAMQLPDRPEEPLHPSMSDFAYKWDRMMERNAMATDMAGILSFAAHEKIRFFLESARTEELADPRWLPVSWDQILSAEREIWKQLGDKLGREVRGLPGQDPPADALLDGILSSKRITHILANAMRPAGRPNPSPSGGPAGGQGKPKTPKVEKPGPSSEELRKRKEQSEKDRAANLLRKQGEEKDPKGKGRGKVRKGGASAEQGQGKKKKAKVQFGPKALIGHELEKDGSPLCWSYNLNGCAKAGDGGKCDKGLHLCAHKGCGFKPHAFKDCPLKQ